MTVTPEENCPPTLILKLTFTLTLNEEQFSPGEIVRTPVKTKETKNRKERKNNRRKKEEIKQKALSFIKLKQTFPSNQNFKLRQK